MYTDGNGKTHRNIAHILLNYTKDGGWITELTLQSLYLEWYGQLLREDTLRRRLDEMFSSGYCSRARRQLRYADKSPLLRAYRLTAKGEGLVRVKWAA